MSDYVSRQAVIDYLMINMNWFDEDDRMVDDWSEKLPIITDLINGVPSVAKDINVPTNWISVKDMLPEDETIVLAVVCYEVGWYRMLAWHDKHGWHSSADEFDERIDGDYVAFWLPIPEAPKEVKQSD